MSRNMLKAWAFTMKDLGENKTGFFRIKCQGTADCVKTEQINAVN